MYNAHNYASQQDPARMSSGTMQQKKQMGYEKSKVQKHQNQTFNNNVPSMVMGENKQFALSDEKIKGKIKDSHGAQSVLIPGSSINAHQTKMSNLNKGQNQHQMISPSNQTQSKTGYIQRGKQITTGGQIQPVKQMKGQSKTTSANSPTNLQALQMNAVMGNGIQQMNPGQQNKSLRQ